MSNDIMSSLFCYFLCCSFFTDVKYIMFVVLMVFGCLFVTLICMYHFCYLLTLLKLNVS